MNYHTLSLTELAELLNSQQVSSLELTDFFLDRIKQDDEKIGAYLAVESDFARQQAQAVDQQRQAGEELSPLAGIPMAVKDNLTVKGLVTTAASKILVGYKPPYTATTVQNLFNQGAVLLGKTNLDEFAHGASCERSAYKITHNPHDLELVPGGSSGGSAAAVAAGLAPYALGSDTGGSIRQPASFCGLVGLKPTYGRCSRYGLLAMTSSTDVVGPLTKNVADAALVLKYLAGQDDKDSTSVKQPQLNFSSLAAPSKLTIGLPKECFSSALDPQVKQVFDDLIAGWKDQGAVFKEVSLPYLEYAVAVYYIITPAEISSNLARYDGLRYGLSAQEELDLKSHYLAIRAQGFGSEAKRRILMGTYVLSHGYYDAYYRQAQKVRTLLINDYQRVFKKVDCLLTPTTPGVAFKIGEKINDPLQMYLEDIFVAAPSIAGLPALSLPVGKLKSLPLGGQLIAPAWKEESLLGAGYQVEQLVA